MLQIPHQRLLLETDCPDALPHFLAKKCEIEERSDVVCDERHRRSRLHSCFNNKCEDGNGWDPSSMSMPNHPANIVVVSVFIPIVIYTFVECRGYQMTLSK